MTKLQKIGLAVVLASIVIGTGGTAWSIYSSFAALHVSENAGIGAVGDWIGKALVFTIAGFVGTMIGVLLLILGRSRINGAEAKSMGDEFSTSGAE